MKNLTESREYWMVTVRPDRRPHAMIVWGLWFDGAFWFGTGSKTQKARFWKRIQTVLWALRMLPRQ